MCSTRKRWAGHRLRKTSGLYGHKPHVGNAVIMFGAATALNHAVVMFPMNCLGALLIFPSRMQVFWSLAKAVLRGLKTPRSSGWITSEQWGGKHTISMPFALASCRVWTSRCVFDPSRKSRTVGLVFACRTNTSKSYSPKTSALLHPFPGAQQ